MIINFGVLLNEIIFLFIIILKDIIKLNYFNCMTLFKNKLMISKQLLFIIRMKK